jgi:uncharacterized protein
MKRNYFNFKKIKDRYLITNDLGRYLFLSPEEFKLFSEGCIAKESELYRRLADNAFIYDSSDLEFINSFGIDVLQQKSYLSQATSLHIFIVTTCCNLSCVYCQASSSLQSGQYMSMETAREAVDIALQSPSRHLTFEFQGGEPLLNFPVIKFIVNYAEKNKGRHIIHYSLVSNLCLLDNDIVDFIREYRFSVSASVDGTRSIHDCNRHYSDGRGSFNALRLGLQSLQTAGISVSAIETTTKYSLRHPEEIADVYRQLGFHDVFIRPLTPLGRAETFWSGIGYSVEAYLSFYSRILHCIIEINLCGYPLREDYAAVFLKRILGTSVNFMELRSPCGGAVGQLAYYSDGAIFTCDEGRMLYEMGDSSFCIGNTSTSTYSDLVNGGICRAVCASSILESIPGCADCVFQPYCGVCPVVNYSLYGDLIEKEPRGYKCRLYMGMQEILFDLLSGADIEVQKLLKSWGSIDEQ